LIIDYLNKHLEQLDSESKLILIFGCMGQTNRQLHRLNEGLLFNNQYEYVPDKYKCFLPEFVSIKGGLL